MFFLNKYLKNKKEKKAFFLIEVLLAIFLVLVGFLAIILLATSGLRESMDSRDQIVAGLLAQEGAELVRNIRDNNWTVVGADSFDNLPSGTKNNCLVDITGSISNGDCSKVFSELQLYYKNNFYTTDSTSPATPVKFHRKIDFSQNSGKLTVTSMVAWGGSFPTVANCTTVNKCVYVQTILTKWGE